MVSKIADQPKMLRPYLFHGLDLQGSEGDTNAKCECPWCGGDTFGVSLETGEWQCWKCQEGTKKGGGNVFTFLRMLHEKSVKGTKTYKALTKSRSLAYSKTLEAWGVCQSYLTEHWLVPGYNHEGKICQLYRYSKLATRWMLLPTSGLETRMFGAFPYDPKKSIVYLCEGPWDAMVLWETLGGIKETTKGLSATSNRANSLLKYCNVLAVPGCKVFKESWCSLFSGKDVRICFDSDHPKKNPKTGRDIPPGGFMGVKRVVGILSGGSTPPKSIGYLRWGENGYDAGRASGYDLRDMLGIGSGRGLGSRLTAFAEMLGMLQPIDDAWLKQPLRGSSGRGKSGGMEYLDCSSYKDLTTAWRKALRWTDGLDRALSVMLAAITSTKSVGDQLWVKIISPASGGKSTLCEALCVNREYVLGKSTIRGFHSGYQTDQDGKEDNSLVAKLAGMTLVTKDGDTLLQSPNLGQILAEARDLYDTVSRTSYRNKASRDYTGIRMTWLLCGTSSLRSIDQSELGERFLDCVIMEGIDLDLEEEILWRKANAASRQIAIESDGRMETHQEPEMTEAMRLTGGYIQYLRENASVLLGQVVMNEKTLRQCMSLGRFVAYMRARPSDKQEENAERELAARLVSQMVRLAKCLAVVLNRETVDAEVMRRVKQVALDTGRGQTMEIMEALHTEPEGLDTYGLATRMQKKQSHVHTLLRFLKKIEAINNYQKTIKGVKRKAKWKMTPHFQRLYVEVMG